MSILPSIDFGHDFNQVMRDLAFRYNDYSELTSDDLSHLFSKIPVALVVEAMNETEKDGLVKFAFTCRDYLFKDFITLVVEDYYKEYIVDLFYAENAHLRTYGLTECDPMHDAGYNVSDFIDLNEYGINCYSV